MIINFFIKKKVINKFNLVFSNEYKRIYKSFKII